MKEDYLFNNVVEKDRVSFAEKTKNDFAWVKKKILQLDRTSPRKIERQKKIELNYNLFNDFYNTEDFAYLTKPFGLETDIKTHEFKHIGIISAPIREILGEETRRPFDPIVLSVNSEAAIKRREEKARLVQEYIIERTLAPIRERILAEGGTEEEKQEKFKALTPPEIENFIKKKFKSPDETQGQQLLNWLLRKENLKHKFNTGFKDVLLVAEEHYLVTIENSYPVVKLVNPHGFDYDDSPDLEFIQEGSWASYERFLTISEIYKEYGEFLDEKQMKQLDNFSSFQAMTNFTGFTDGILIDAGEAVIDTQRINEKVRVFHAVFKTLKKIKFITTVLDGVLNETIVDETYELNPETDIKERIAWIPEVWEGTRIGKDLFVKLGPIEGQYTNLNNPYEVNLPYYGVRYDARNSEATSLFDRGKVWNHMFDAAFYRLEEAIGSDYGNIMVAVMKHIPKGWSPEHWLSFLKTTKVAMIDPTQDGPTMGSDPQFWRSVDLSSNSDIQKYVNLLSYCQEQCYAAIGTNQNRLGSSAASETVGNNQQKIIQSANITEPVFALHNLLKERVCTALVECAKIAFKGRRDLVSFFLDDMSVELLDLNVDSLALSEFGVFISNNLDDYNMVQQLRGNIQALIQNSDGDLRLVARALRTKNPAALEEAINEKYEELLKQRQEQAAMAQEQLKQQIDAEAKERQLDRDARLKEAAIRALGFSNDSDINKDMIPDLLQMHKFNKDFEIKMKELELRKEELVENNKSEAADRALKEKELQTKKIKSDVSAK